MFFFLSFCLVQLPNGTLTQWSRACRKSNSSSVQSSSVEDREPTLVSHCSRRSQLWMQCSVSAHFCRSDSIGSWRRKFNTQSNWLSIRDTYASVSVQMSAMPYSWGKKESPFGKKKKIHEVGGLFLFSFYIRENCHTFFSNIKWQSKLSLFVFLNWFCSVKTKIKPSVIMGYILWFC